MQEPRDVVAVKELAEKSGVTAVSLPVFYDIGWALVDAKGVVKTWVHAIEEKRVGDNFAVDMQIFRAGLALSRDTAATFMLVIMCQGRAINYVATRFAPWSFGIDPDTLEPVAYVSSKYVIDSLNV